MSREDWAILDPLTDPTRTIFETEFPEIPTPDLCNIVVEFRMMRAQEKAKPRPRESEIERKIETLEGAVQNLLYMLDPDSTPPPGSKVKPLPEAVFEAIPGSRLPLMQALRAYRSAIWSARSVGTPNETGALVAALKRHFDRHRLPVDSTQGGRFVRAVQIVVEALDGKRIETAYQLESLAKTVAYHLNK